MNKKYETIQIDGVDYKTTIPKKWLDHKRWEAPDERLIVPQIPGTIVKVLVKEGDKVEEGDLLLVLQAMKMDNKVAAPVHGVVKTVNVKAGDKVAKGQIMIEIE